MTHVDGTRKTDMTIDVRHQNSDVAKILDKEKSKVTKDPHLLRMNVFWTRNPKAHRKKTLLQLTMFCGTRKRELLNYHIKQSQEAGDICWSKLRKSHTPSKYLTVFEAFLFFLDAIKP